MSRRRSVFAANLLAVPGSAAATDIDHEDIQCDGAPLEKTAPEIVQTWSRQRELPKRFSGTQNRVGVRFVQDGGRRRGADLR